jgi:hypothetical protein
MVSGLFAAMPCGLASQVIPMDLRALAQKAEVIAVGRCSGCVAEWNEKHTRIQTTVTIQVSEYVKGYLGAQITFRQPGGRVGTSETYISGMPRFAPGQQVVVFLAKDSLGGYQVLGMSQGLYQVDDDTASGARTVRALSSSLHGAASAPAGPGTPRASRVIPLSSFLARIRAELEGGQ